MNSNTYFMDKIALEQAVANQGLLWTVRVIAAIAEQMGMANSPHDLTVALRESNLLHDCADKIRHGEVRA